MYEEGLGVTQSFAMARLWIEKAAASGSFLGQPHKGDTQAQVWLGKMYVHGMSVPQSYTRAIKWFETAAAQGDEEAQRCLGGLYSGGME